MKQIFYYSLLITALLSSNLSMAMQRGYSNPFAKQRGNPEHLEKLRTTGECVKCDLRDMNVASAIMDYYGDYYNKYPINLEGSDLSRADLSNSDLRWANLSKTRLASANFAGANLRRADLTGAYAKNTNFARANLAGAILNCAIFQHANLTNANLTNADLMYTNLIDTELTAITLTNVCFKGLRYEQHGCEDNNY